MEDLGQLQMVVVVTIGFFALGNLIWVNLGFNVSNFSKKFSETFQKVK